jgi:hypothetical protein
LTVLRVVYIAFAVLVGVAFSVASVGYLWQGIEAAIDFEQCKSTVQSDPAVVVNCYGIDGPDPLSFESYGKGLFFAAAFLLIAFAALKRRWGILWLPSWFLVAPFAVQAVANVIYFGWRSLLGYICVQCAWQLIPAAGIVVAARSPAVSGAMSARVALAVLVAVSYLGSAIAVARSVEATRALDVLRGGHTYYTGNIEFVSASIVGVVAAVALLFAAVFPLWGKARALNAAFAFSAGLSLPGFLQTIDLVLSLQESRHAAYAIQDAVAFIASVAAVMLVVPQQQIQTANCLRR